MTLHTHVTYVAGMSNISTAVALSRSLFRELKRTHPEVRSSQLWRYVVSEVRREPPSTAEGGLDRINVLSEYVDYLRTTREHRELLSFYQGRGERSTEETAKLVGLKVP